MLLLSSFLCLAFLVATGYSGPTKPSSLPLGYWNTSTTRIRNGTIHGTHSDTYNQDFFLGIPFAQPPVGDLRFRNPASINTTFKDALQATEYAPECVGYGSDDVGYPQSEDCLYLNVIRPSGHQHRDLPVAVWIHGGALIMGGTRDVRYNLSYIVENSVEIGKPIIAVSIAYRLGAWGFIGSEEILKSGTTNLGLKDQRLALHWIQENIRAFGGDPRKVTIWGESAGAASVGWHLTAFNGRDDHLFRAGIMESGNPISYASYRDVSEYQPKYDALVEAVGCTVGSTSLDCLRQAPFDTLNSSIAATTTGPLTMDWQPIIDGDFIARPGSEQLADGAFVKVPIIDGANTDEGTAFTPYPLTTVLQLAAAMGDPSALLYLPASDVPGALAAYPDSDGSILIPSLEEIGDLLPPSFVGNYEWRRGAGYFGDAVMIANRRATCQTWAANNIDAYCYRFNTLPAGLPAFVGVTHFQEVAWVFNNTQGNGYTTSPFAGQPESYYQLAKLISSTWASFIADLDVSTFDTRFAAPAWPKYTNDQPQNIVWDANVTALAYTETDDFRKEGIQWIIDHAAAYRR